MRTKALWATILLSVKPAVRKPSFPHKKTYDDVHTVKRYNCSRVCHQDMMRQQGCWCQTAVAILLIVPAQTAKQQVPG
jgi:hypothetical protein